MAWRAQKEEWAARRAAKEALHQLMVSVRKEVRRLSSRIKRNARKAAYKKTPKGKEAARRRRNTPHGRAARKSHSIRRRALKLYNTQGVHHTSADIGRIHKQQRNKCAYSRVCGQKLNNNFHVDHIIPLSVGGSNAADNIQLTCPTCNISKGAKDPIDFARSLGALL